MRLSRSAFVTKRRKDQKLGKNSRAKKKHKRLDAICEKAYNRSHRKGVEEVESSELNNGGTALELRRSIRARRAPVFLDSSPPPPRKRQRIDKRSGVDGADRVKIEDGVRCETVRSSSRNLEGENNGWQFRLRSRDKSANPAGRERRETLPRGKRKLFDDFDGSNEGAEPNLDDKKVDVVDGNSTVKLTRPGKIIASNVLANENLEIDLGDDMEDDTEKNKEELLEVTDEGDGLHAKFELERKNEDEVEAGTLTSQMGEKRETKIQTELQLGDCPGTSNVETMEQDIGVGKQESACAEDQNNVVEADCATRGDANEEECRGEPLEDETSKKLNGPKFDSDVVLSKPGIKPGRRCGLCGGGTDGKPPKILIQDGASSDNEIYSGSSASEEPNYDVWDGFGDESGWLGRLLGPINDRFGIARIWVHQQCAVWSPEVYFAGLGRLKNVRAALCRGRVLKCSRCRRPGATIGCRVDRCPKTYHVPCARAKGCIFDHRKFLIACTDHRHLFQPHGSQYVHSLKKMKAKKMKLEIKKMSNDARRKDVEAEEKWLENCGEDEEFLRRESKRLHRDLLRIAPVYIGGTNSENDIQFKGWESVAGLQDVIRCMKEVVILPLLYPEYFDNLGLVPPRGVLLHGYPGTGKTLVVRALIGSCARGDKRIAYFARKGADCLGKYVGDAERQLRLLFQVAEKSQPSIIFFDEIDGLAPCRTKQQDQTHSSVVSTLLALMDGLKSRGSVIVIGATNRPDAVDPALRRPGRFDREIYFPLPSVKDREAILSLHTQKWPKPITGSLLKWVTRQTVGFAGADLQALCTQAAIIALRRSFSLQKVLHEAGGKASQRVSPPIPNFSVEERDWLEALSHAPPPCSRREAGIAANDVVSSPLDSHLIPCLLQPLTRLLISLYLNEHVWLPPPLSKAATLVKDVIISFLDRKRVQTDNWWLHANDLLQQANVTSEIEKNLSLANVLIGGLRFCSSDALEDNSRDCLKTSNFQLVGARPWFMQNISYASGNRSGFQILISGNPRSGQRHLASCLLHCFVGNVDMWKVDLASISQEGHGDMVHGLTRILMRCAGTQTCMIFMPRIDLWAVETSSEACEEDSYSVSLESQISERISCNSHGEVDKEDELCPRAGQTEMAEAPTAVKKASYLWNYFLEQVEPIRVHASLIILATSEVPSSLFPQRIRQFFERDTVSCSLSTQTVDAVPRFSVQLDGNFDHDRVIDSFASKLSKDLAQHFVQFIHRRSHIHLKPVKETKACDTVEGNVDKVCHSSDPGSATVLDSKSCPISPVALTNKAMKGRSGLLVAISTLGYQILCYPHFAELCWVTSKLKEGPHADISGSWKGWPFNSCIVRPMNSAEQFTVASGSINIKSKEKFGLVRGLVAVGLSAYRGEYKSLREVTSGVRKVLELLVALINDKVQAGKDRYQFIHLLSQVAYLEDIVISWVYALRSLEVDAQISEAKPNACTGSLDYNNARKNGNLGTDQKLDVSDGTLHDPKMLEESPHKFGAKDSNICVDLYDGDNGCPDTGGDVVTALEPSRLVVSGHSSPVKSLNGPLPNEVKSQVSMPKDTGDHAEHGCVGSVQHSNGFREVRCGLQDGPGVSGDKHGIALSWSSKAGMQDSGLSSAVNDIPSENSKENSGGHGLDTDYSSKSTTLQADSFFLCLYDCCSECLVNLQNFLRRIINSEWGLKGRDSSVDGVHDFVASLSVNLHIAVSKLPAESFVYSCDRKWEQGLGCQKIDTPQCENSEKGMPMECGCHATSERANFFKNSHHRLDSKFVFRDGVLVTPDTGDDVSYHCKFKKLCLCFLIEWMAMNREPLD
ncbi:P-loop containing nucleoside triphosphate hydrolase superfamily protein [Abeliophyllum distichum]|uniref:P-loop containing nucleoside triphosphate hydrolase superfamily protein n=1 Tax=Abeliophyllum distichum TaxID=126358 RepID=A0ABD1UF26_9LAMI